MQEKLIIRKPGFHLNPNHKHALIRNSQINRQESQKFKEKKEDILSKKLVISERNQLPIIRSPFLKKTVTNLFPFRSCQFSPADQGLTGLIQKYSKSIWDQDIRYKEKVHRIFNSIEIIDETNQQDRNQTRTLKSLSEIKPISKVSPQRSASKENPKGRIPHASTQQSASAYNKKLRDQSSQVDLLIPSTQSQNPQKDAFEKLRGKDHKALTFVTKHKLTHSLYFQEKSEIKMVKNILASKNHDKFDKSIKIKNYAKFVPKVIHIQT